MSSNGWIGVDLDATLAEYDHWRGIEHIGAPVPAMVARVKQWLSEGKDVRIMTARVCSMPGTRTVEEAAQAAEVIQTWCEEHIGVRLSVTNVKDFGMVVLYDDRCVQVEPNTGELVVHETPPCPSCGERMLGTATIGERRLLRCMGCGARFEAASR